VRFGDAAAASAARARFEANGVAVRPGIANAHEDPMQSDGIRGSLNESERCARECLLLPLLPQMTDAELDAVIGALSVA